VELILKNLIDNNMMDFKKVSKTQIVEWVKENKICFVTNSKTQYPASLFLSSLKTYIDYIPKNSFMIIPGADNAKAHYGLSAFADMINILLSTPAQCAFDYVIYIDEDCFINDFPALMNEFAKFKEGNYCLAGMPDGGMICHRNKSRILVNTFLSFWNIKAIRENMPTFSNNFGVLVNLQKPYKLFIEKLKDFNDGEFYDIINNSSNDIIKKCQNYREKHFKSEPPHATVVKDDPTNFSEPHQTPYSFEYDAETNAEPYYSLEEAIVFATMMPIYYLFGVDLYRNEIVEYDNSGITTVILGENEEEIAYHTWFARYYQPLTHSNDIIKYHTNRINSIIDMIDKNNMTK